MSGTVFSVPRLPSSAALFAPPLLLPAAPAAALVSDAGCGACEQDIFDVATIDDPAFGGKKFDKGARPPPSPPAHAALAQLR